MGARVAEIDQNAVAHVFRNKPVEVPDEISDGAMICSDDLAQILGIEASGELGRADQIAEHHRQLPALGIGPHGRIAGGRCRHRGTERGDGVEQPPTMPDQDDAEILQILGRQARQYPLIDLVRAERRLVLLEPEPSQPLRDIHRRHPPMMRRRVVSYAFAGIARVSAR